MGTHAKLSPSAAERWFNCSGSLNLIATLPPEAFKTSKYAAEGIVAHQLAEDFVQGKVDLLTLTSRVGEYVAQDGVDVEITDAMVEGVIEYVDHIAATRKRMTKPAGVVGEAEVRVIAESVSPEVFGTADYILFQKGHELHVFDFKYGKGVVEAEENKQGMIYLVGAQDSRAGRAFDAVFFHIVQPRARHNEGALRPWRLPQGRIEAFRKELAAAVARTKEQKAPRVAGPWCHKTFCPAMAYCPEARGAIEAGAQVVFTQIPVPPSKEVALGLHLPPVEKMTIEQLGRALDWEDFLDSFMEACRERMQAEIVRDPVAAEAAGYKLVEGRANRVWGSEETAESAFAMLGEDRYAPRKLKTPAQMEKLAGKDEVAKYTVKPAGKLTVAKASDKRPAATQAPGDASAVFGQIGGPLPGDDDGKGVVFTEQDVFGDLLGGAPKQAEPSKAGGFWPQ